MERVKPCPFCGSQATVIQHEDDHYNKIQCTTDVYFSISCIGNDCPVEFNVFDSKTEEQAIAKWNERTD
jgi:Lar family restriction alleviation protein